MTPRAYVSQAHHLTTRTSIPVFSGLLIIACVITLVGCDSEEPTRAWSWELPTFVEPPPIPETNPMNYDKVELGRYLFYEERLSLNGELSCESCHEQARAFTVQEAKHMGADGDLTPRNAQSLANVAYASYLTWGNLTFLTLEQQMLTPLFGDDPIELGAGFIEGSSDHYHPQRLRSLVQEDARYQRLFSRAFPDQDEPITWDNAIKAIACFQRSLVSFNSPWDRWLSGDDAALSPSQERGRSLFFSERLGCSTCHTGPLLSSAFPTDLSRPARDDVFKNTGLYFLTQGEVAYLDGAQSTYPAPNQGIGEFSQQVIDDGKHRVPSLKNVALTSPYMHDGSVSSLEAVIEHYARGGRLIEVGPLRGDGRMNPYKDPRVSGFELTDTEQRDLISFLHSLTDEHFTRDVKIAKPPRL